VAAALAVEDYKEVLLFLGTAGIVVPLFRRLKISPVIGFLGAGILLGPQGLGQLSHLPWLAALTLDDTDRIAQIAEFGVVFLLFMIGLELSYERLVRLRRLVFGLGAAQVLACSAALAVCAHLLLGLSTGSALLVGAALALSSTAVVIPVLIDRRRLSTTAGRTSFAVLLFQDLMVAPLLFAISMASDGAGHSWGLRLAETALPALAVVALLVLGGRLLLRPFFRLVAQARSTELFMAACLVIVIGTGVSSHAGGLSMALGAFIAGMLLGETEYRREVETTLEPFKGLLLGLFFVSVGASLDLALLFKSPLLVLGITVGLVLIKLSLTFGLARMAGLPFAAARESAYVIAPGGEFAFVMLSAAVLQKIIPSETASLLTLSVTLSMMLIPLLAVIGGRERKRDPATLPPQLAARPDEVAKKGHVIVVGYGRVGQLVGDMLKRHNRDFIALDGSTRLVTKERANSPNLYWGDATKIDLLRACGLETASALVITINAHEQSEKIVELTRKARPDLTIVARARDAHHASHLYTLGVTDAIPETLEASLQLAEAVLVDIGVPMGYVIASVHEKRDEFRKMLQIEEDSRTHRAVRLSTRIKDLNKPKPQA
jgi:CPA2 family monovalent cation:H+ antiporter-2